MQQQGHVKIQYLGWIPGILGFSTQTNFTKIFIVELNQLWKSLRMKPKLPTSYRIKGRNPFFVRWQIYQESQWNLVNLNGLFLLEKTVMTAVRFEAISELPILIAHLLSERSSQWIVGSILPWGQPLWRKRLKLIGDEWSVATVMVRLRSYSEIHHKFRIFTKLHIAWRTTILCFFWWIYNLVIFDQFFLSKREWGSIG